VSIQEHSIPAPSPVFSASDGIGVPHAAGENTFIRRLLDIVLALVALLLCLPVLAIIALAIVWDSGEPVFFRQRRVGRHGKIFSIYKFRTMHVLEDGAQMVQAFRGDARITRVGHFLRITSLDELPQLLNVLKGEMSLVGPRPHAVTHDEYYSALIPDYHLRYAVKPGITGLAQVNGARGATPKLSDMQTRIDFDIQYVERESIWLYLKILARTPLVVLRRRNAV
jgi:putative colanic acid biosynthesis UDP-glucose lipid carrier transferase